MKLTEVFEQYMIDAENKGRADGTLVIYRRMIGLLMSWLESKDVVDIECVTLALLRQFLQFLNTSDTRFPKAIVDGRLSPRTVANYVTTIKAFFHWSYEEELIPADPSARLKKPKIPEKVIRAFTPEHIDRMLATCDTETMTGFRDYVMLLLFLDTGMRLSELRGLKVSDVYTRYVRVFGKGSKEREIGLHPEVSKLLWKYIQKYRGQSECEQVFLGERGPLTNSGIESIFARIKDESGITDVRVSPHTLRHTFSKQYLINGGDLFKLSRELGHSNVQITGKTYLGDFNSSDAREAHDSHSPVGKMHLARVKDGKKARRRR